MFDNVKLAIAPIGWTNDDLTDLGAENTFEQCISEMALAGFSGCEVGNKYPSNTATLKKALGLRGLEICNRWFSTFLLTKPFAEIEKDFRETMEFMREMGAKVIGVSEQSHSIQGTEKPVLFDKYVMDEDEWALLCDGLNRLGKIALEYGIALTFHHHMGTVVQNEDEIDKLMENTDPELVSLLYDTGHLVYAGVDEMSVLNKHINRIKHVHLKDVRPEQIQRVRAERLSFLQGVRGGTFTVPGDGSIKFEPVFEKLAQAGYAGWFVVEAEQDPAVANPFEYALKARKYINEKTGL